MKIFINKYDCVNIKSHINTIQKGGVNMAYTNKDVGGLNITYVLNKLLPVVGLDVLKPYIDNMNKRKNYVANMNKIYDIFVNCLNNNQIAI